MVVVAVMMVSCAGLLFRATPPHSSACCDARNNSNSILADRSVNIMSPRNLSESVTLFFLARFHSFFHGKFISVYKPFCEFLVLQNLSTVQTWRASFFSLLTQH